MTLSDECALSCYAQVAAVDESHGVYAVQHRQSGCIYIKKILTVYNASVFRYIKDHPIRGIPEIYEVIEDEGKLIIIEEYVSGDTLKTVLGNGNRFTEEQALSIMRQLCAILSALHSASPPIIHRDVKPSNIILTSGGEVRLIDMNAAKFRVENRSEDTSLMGTVGYAAPEQYGFGASGVQADIYSAGVLLNELLTGEHPQKRTADGRLGRVIKKCTMMDPKDRYASADELLRDLDRDTLSGKEKPLRQFKYMIPGFRSRSPTHMAFAVMGYTLIFAIGLTLKVNQEFTPAQIWLERILFIACALLTVFISANYLDIWTYLKIDKIKSPFLKTAAILLADAAAVMVLLLAAVIVRPRN